MASIHEILKHYWGYDSFRPLQEDIINTIMSGHDTLALLPTGGGKSLCFQVPVLASEGVALVISPLISLMKDQVQQLQSRGIKAEAIYSGMHYNDIDRIVDNVVFGHVKLLYLSPERLKTDIIQQRIQKMPLSFIAIDEAHCVSQWGYDFRPSYLEIANIRELVPDVPLIALTATATPEVVKDIQEKLLFGKESKVWQKSFERTNLAYVVRKAEGKIAQLADILKKVPGSAVVYVRSRKKCKDIAIELLRRNISASFYHAGLTMEERSVRQEGWINGQIRVIVATNAFGMGIDKSDVRTVVHLDLPDSLEAYFQEAGRAGRDGQKAYAVLLYTPSDKDQLEKQYRRSFPELKTIRQIYRALGSYFQLATDAGQGQSFDFDLTAFAQTYELDPFNVYHCLKVLEQNEWLVLSDAVYTPAKMQVIVNKDILYDYQLKHAKQDAILKIILRSYQGVFTYPVNIKEAQLAKFLKISKEKLQDNLKGMAKAGIIRYTPVKESPQLTFLRNRVQAEVLSIDITAYNFRKKRQEGRIQSAVRYAEFPHCRSKQLLRYFGEKSDTNCGICDICSSNKKAAPSVNQHQVYAEQIKILLQSPLNLEDIVLQFSEKEEEPVLAVLAYLLDEGFVALQENQKYLWVA